MGMKFGQLCCLLVLGMGTCGQAFGQQYLLGKPLQITAKDEDVLKILGKIFAHQKTHVIVESNVVGKITLDVRNGTFDTVFQDVLRQVDATFRVVGDIYQIILRPSFRNQLIETQKSDHRRVEQDGDDIYVVQDLHISKIRKSDMKLQASRDIERRFPKTTVDLSDPKGREQLRQLFELANVSMDISPLAKGVVTIPEGPASEQSAMLAISKSPGQHSLFLDGRIYITQPISKILDLSLLNKIYLARPVYAVEPSPRLKFDRSYVYLVQGDWAYKIRKSDLATVSYSRIN